MEILLHKNAYRRISQQLHALSPNFHFICVDSDGDYSRDGEVIARTKAAPQVFWLSLDFFESGQFNAAFDMALDPGTVKWMQTINSGLDKGRYKEILQNNIRLTNSNAQSIAIAEYVMAHALNVFHSFAAQNAAQKNRAWIPAPFSEICGMTWLIIGFGPIGRAVADRARAFGVNLIVVRRQPNSHGMARVVGRLEDLPILLPKADVVLLACALNTQTRCVADASFFKHMKQNSVLINVARGELVDEEALLFSLDERHLKMAILDVFSVEPLASDSKFWSHSRVRVTAHTSWAGSGTVQRADELFIKNLAHYMNDEPLEMEVKSSQVF